jgi:hypothetical protein
MPEVKEKWKDNEKLFYERISILKRNQGREWGVLGV